MATTTATTTATPLTTFPQQQTINQTTRLGASNAPSTSLTNPAPSSSIQPPSTALAQTPPPQTLPRYANRPPTWGEKLANSFSLANGLSTMALLAAFIFGIGAWVGMKVQISQGGKSMELAIWTTCADHTIIQNSTLCQSIMSKDFSELASRDLSSPSGSANALTVVVKRDLSSSEDIPPPQSHYSKLLSSLSPDDRTLIEARNDRWPDARHPTDPALRATIFPLVTLLVRPLTYLFDFLESLLLLAVFTLHKLFSWSTWLLLFTLQALIYSTLESLLNKALQSLDAAIYAALPAGTPYLLASNLASWVGLSGLRAFWYGTSFWGSLKWNMVFRVGMWAVAEVFKGGVWAWGRWNEVVEERRRMQGEVPGQFDGEGRSQLWSDVVNRRAFVADLQRQYG